MHLKVKVVKVVNRVMEIHEAYGTFWIGKKIKDMLSVLSLG